VRLVERLGNETLAAVVLASGQQIIAALPGDVDVGIGENLSLAPQPEKASLFLATGAAVH
jgi:multiple sugar transport system ATP-binding protein